MPLLFLAFVVLPFVELFLLIRIGRVVGSGTTIAFVLAMGFLGAYLAKTQGRKVLLEWQRALSEGRVPEEGVLGGVLVLIGGLLLITPGVITDVLGFFCLLPASRRVLAQQLQRYLQSRIAQGQVQVVSMRDFGFQGPFEAQSKRTRPSRPLGGDVIDTEGEEISSKPADE